MRRRGRAGLLRAAAPGRSLTVRLPGAVRGHRRVLPADGPREAADTRIAGLLRGRRHEHDADGPGALPAGDVLRQRCYHQLPRGPLQPLSGQVRCDNACPPGSFCPEGSAEPVPCPVGTFSLGLVEACTPCPYYDGQTTQACFDDRYCCPEFTT